LGFLVKAAKEPVGRWFVENRSWGKDASVTTAPALSDNNLSSPLDDEEASTKQRSLASRCRNWKPGILPALYLILWAIVLVVAFVALGYLLTKVGERDPVGKADHSIERWFARDRVTELNKITYYTTYLGETIPVIVIGIILAIAAGFLWRRWREPVLVAVALAGEVSIFVTVTLLIDRRRPPVHHLDAAPPTSSFPSGHTAAAVVLYLLAALLLSSRLQNRMAQVLVWTLAVLLPILVGLSRLYRGMHYPTDVVSGALLGGAWLFSSVKGVRLGGLHHDLHEGGEPMGEGRR
jgi:membrane-associated phospholipid phosphatase